ncbi:MAG TPA: hypothetical protein ENJ00_09600 [Phycisphaerales bacterium]|nr:hypothetical protein [Phycisphaerales bacterium]
MTHTIPTILLQTDTLLPGIVFTAGIVLLIVVLMSRLKKTRKQLANQPDLVPSERIEMIRQQADTRGSTEARIADAADITRQLTASLDNRAERLEILIRHADERIARLEQLNQQAADRLAPRMPGHQPAAAEPTGSLANDTLRQQIYDLADQGHPCSEIAQRLGQHSGKVELILALRRA